MNQMNILFLHRSFKKLRRSPPSAAKWGAAQFGAVMPPERVCPQHTDMRLISALNRPFARECR